MNNFKDLAKILICLFSLFVAIHFYHSTLHIDEKNYTSNENYQMDKDSLKVAMEPIMQLYSSDFYSTQIEKFHTHIQRNEMQILLQYVDKSMRRNNLVTLNQSDFDTIKVIVHEREKQIIEEEKEVQRKINEERLKSEDNLFLLPPE